MPWSAVASSAGADASSAGADAGGDGDIGDSGGGSALSQWPLPGLTVKELRKAERRARYGAPVDPNAGKRGRGGGGRGSGGGGRGGSRQ